MVDILIVALVCVFALILVGLVLGKLTWERGVTFVLVLVIIVVLVYWLLNRT